MSRVAIGKPPPADLPLQRKNRALSEYEKGHFVFFISFLYLIKYAFPTVKLLTIWADAIVLSCYFWLISKLAAPEDLLVIHKSEVIMKIFNVMSNATKECFRLRSESVPHFGSVTIWKTLKESPNFDHKRKLKIPMLETRFYERRFDFTIRMDLV